MQAVSLAADTVTLAFDVGSVAPAGDMRVDVVNSGIGSVTVAGLVDNPVGSISIANPQGPILATAAGILRGQSVAVAGAAVGTREDRLAVYLVRSAARPTGLAATATAGDAWLTVTGRVRDTAVGIHDFAAGDVTAGAAVDILFQPTLQETAAIAGTIGSVSVTLNSGAAELFTEHYPVDTATGNRILDYRIFADTTKATEAAGAFTFGAITGTSITLAAARAEAADPRIDITATTNHAKTDNIDALFSGSITLT